MRIKKFVAPSIQAALNQIKQDFGDDAIIISRKKIDNHPEWPKAVEVTAAVEKPEAIKPDFKTFLNSKQKEAEEEKQSEASKTNLATLDEHEFGSLQQEVENISYKLENLISHVQSKALPVFPKPLQKRVNVLTNTGLNLATANELAEDLLINLSGDELFHSDIIDKRLKTLLKNEIKVTGQFKFMKDFPLIVPIIGTTGVGKTTTIAKLATVYRYKYGKKVGVASCDNYRIGAMDQLKSFCELSEIDFATIFDAEEAATKLKKLALNDLILVDTPGINPRDKQSLHELIQLIKAVKADEVHLCLSMTTRSNDLINILKSFNKLPITGLIYTKVDETKYYGDIINISKNFDIPISYLTDGQSIPDDVTIAERAYIAHLILNA